MLHSALHPGFSRIQGVGVIALRDLPIGTAVWWPCPRCVVIPPNEFGRTPIAVQQWVSEYGYRRADGSHLTPCGGAFLINHSCDASVLDCGLAVGVTVQEVGRGEEITCDYRGFRYEDPWRFSCNCGVEGCCGEVAATGDAVSSVLSRTWSERLRVALIAAPAVPQETFVLSGDVHGRLQ